MSTSVSLQSLETELIWSVQKKLRFTERSPLWLCRSNVHLGIYKMAILVDSSVTALLFPSKRNWTLPVFSYLSQSSYLISRAFHWHDNGQSFNKIFSDGNPPFYISLSHPSLISFSHFPSVSSIALRAVGLTNFSIPTPAASLSKLCLWIPHQTELHYKAPYHSSFKCLTAKGKIRSCGVLVLKPDYWSGGLMVDITMEMKQKKRLIDISLHIQFGPISNVVLNLVQFISGMWSSDLHLNQDCAKVCTLFYCTYSVLTK